MNIISTSLGAFIAPTVASAQFDPTVPYQQAGPGMNPSYNPNQTAYQSGAAVDSGAGLLVVGIIIYFLFFKKKGGGTS